MDETSSDTCFESTDQVLWWASTLDHLPPELKYLVLKQGKEKLLEGASQNVIKTYSYLLKESKENCDIQLASEIFKEACVRVYRRNKPFFVICLVGSVFSVAMGIYHLGKFLGNVV